VTLNLASAADANVKDCTRDVRRLENDMWRERVRIMSEVIGVDMPQTSVDAGLRATTPVPPPSAGDDLPPPADDDDDLERDEAPPPYTALPKPKVRS